MRRKKGWRCRIGAHDWFVTGIGNGFGFDREFAVCTCCGAERHVDYGAHRGDVYSTKVYSKGKAP